MPACSGATVTCPAHTENRPPAAVASHAGAPLDELPPLLPPPDDDELAPPLEPPDAEPDEPEAPEEPDDDDMSPPLDMPEVAPEEDWPAPDDELPWF